MSAEMHHAHVLVDHVLTVFIALLPSLIVRSQDIQTLSLSLEGPDFELGKCDHFELVLHEGSREDMESHTTVNLLLISQPHLERLRKSV